MKLTLLSEHSFGRTAKPNHSAYLHSLNTVHRLNMWEVYGFGSVEQRKVLRLRLSFMRMVPFKVALTNVSNERLRFIKGKSGPSFIRCSAADSRSRIAA